MIPANPLLGMRFTPIGANVRALLHAAEKRRCVRLVLASYTDGGGVVCWCVLPVVGCGLPSPNRAVVCVKGVRRRDATVVSAWRGHRAIGRHGGSSISIRYIGLIASNLMPSPSDVSTVLGT